MSEPLEIPKELMDAIDKYQKENPPKKKPKILHTRGWDYLIEDKDEVKERIMPNGQTMTDWILNKL